MPENEAFRDLNRIVVPKKMTAALRSGLLPPPPPLPDEVTSEDGDENKGLCDHKVLEMLRF